MIVTLQPPAIIETAQSAKGPSHRRRRSNPVSSHNNDDDDDDDDDDYDDDSEDDWDMMYCQENELAVICTRDVFR